MMKYLPFLLFLLMVFSKCSYNSTVKKTESISNSQSPSDPFDQKKLYVELQIDSILITFGEDTVTRQIIFLDSSGNKRKIVDYCPDNRYSEIKRFDEFENEILKINFGYECDKIDTNKIYWKRTSEYKNNLLIKSESIDQYGQSDHSVVNTYDKKNRLLLHTEFSYSWIAFTDEYEYEDHKIIITRMGGESHSGKLIGITEIKLDSLDREIESAYYTEAKNSKILHSIYFTEYDEFGNIKRYAGYFYPGKILQYQYLNFYSSKSKLDSSLQYTFDEGKLVLRSKYIYQYDRRKLLSKEIYENYIGNSTYVRNYYYK